MNDLIFNPGFYTKFRLNQNGEIIGADQIEKKDLPEHTHDLKDITGDFKKEIIEVLSTFFANSEDSAVEFSFDPLTATVTADVKIDGENVSKNEYGQLTSSGESVRIEKPIESPASISIKDVEKKVYDILSTAFTNNDVVTFDWDAKAHTFDTDIKIDGISISKNLEGELQALSSEHVYPDSIGCATHTHTVSQIKDFEEAVKALLEKYGQTGFNVEVLQNFIDNETIIINEYGQLASVSTVVGKHGHVLKDIEDYVPPEPAAKQAMKDLGDNVTYNSGVIDFKELNIGYSILAISQYLKDVVNKNITNLNSKINQLSANGNDAGSTSFTVHRASIKNTLYDKNNNCYRDVYYADQLQLTLDFLAKTSGDIELYVNGVLKDSTSIPSLVTTGYSSGVFKVERTYYKNFNLVKVLKIDVREFVQKEGLYTFKLKYVTDVAEDYSTALDIFVTPYKSLDYVIEDITETHKIFTTKYYTPVQFYKYKVSIKNYRNYRFINNLAGFENGVLYGYTDKPVTISLPNLFTATSLEIDFPYEKEESNSVLYNYMVDIKGAAVINDVVIPEVKNEKYSVTFAIPKTNSCNAMKLWQFPVKGCSIYKNKEDIAQDVVIANWPNQSGLVPLSVENYKLLWLSGYDMGKSNLNLTIESTKPINLKKLMFEPCTL